MNVRKYMAIAVLAAASLSVGTVSAKAESVLKGTFELPAPVYWGNTLLQPGQYSIWMNTEMRDLAHVPMIHVTGEGVNLRFLVVPRPETESARNVLEISDIDGTHVVRAFDAGLIGQSFVFGVTKSVKAKALRAGDGSISTVAVTAAGF